MSTPILRVVAALSLGLVGLWPYFTVAATDATAKNPIPPPSSDWSGALGDTGSVVLDHFLQALHQGDMQAAWSLLSKRDQQVAHPRVTRHLLRQDVPLTKATVLRQLDSDGVRQRYAVDVDGQVLSYTLVQENRLWKVHLNLAMRQERTRNLAQIEALQGAAEEFMRRGNFRRSTAVMERILSLDPENDYALQGLKTLAAASPN